MLTTAQKIQKIIDVYKSCKSISQINVAKEYCELLVGTDYELYGFLHDTHLKYRNHLCIEYVENIMNDKKLENMT